MKLNELGQRRREKRRRWKWRGRRGNMSGLDPSPPRSLYYFFFSSDRGCHDNIEHSFHGERLSRFTVWITGGDTVEKGPSWPLISPGRITNFDWFMALWGCYLEGGPQLATRSFHDTEEIRAHVLCINNTFISDCFTSSESTGKQDLNQCFELALHETPPLRIRGAIRPSISLQHTIVVSVWYHRSRVRLMHLSPSPIWFLRWSV